MPPPSSTALGLCITFPILASVSMLARVFVRRSKHQNLELGDWVIVVATILSIANGANVLTGAIVADIGQHTPKDPDELGPMLVNLAIVNYVAQVVVGTAIGLARWSILLLYAKLFTVKRFQLPVRVMYALNGAWTIAFGLVYLFQCIPIDHLWTDLEEPRKGCVDLSVNLYFAVSSVILDVLVLFMPWPMTWRLQMPLAKKAAVLGVLMLGALIVAVSIGKTYAFFSVEDMNDFNSDILYNDALLFYWTVPECCLSVVCANLPTLAPLFHSKSPRPATSSFRKVFHVERHFRGLPEINFGRSNGFSAVVGYRTSKPSESRESVPIENKTPLPSTNIQVKTLLVVESRPID